MAGGYLEGVDRDQSLLLPERVEDYVSPDSLVRVVDAFVDGLSVGKEAGSLPPLREMGSEGGRKGYSPHAMAKILIWGYLQRVRSTRALERATHVNLEVIWLLRTLKPDHSSISRFRAAHSKRIKRWIKEFNLICAKLGLFGGEEIAVDGVILKAVNSKANNYTQGRLEKRIEKLEAKIEAYLKALEESEKEPCEEFPAEVEELQGKIDELGEAKKEAEAMLEQAQQSVTGQLSLVDEDARLLKKKTSAGSAQVGYIAQSAVDSENHLIAAVEVTQQSSDRGQLTPMLEAACEGMGLAESDGQRCAQDSPIRGLADGGYCDFDDIAAAEKAGFEPHVSLSAVPKNEQSNNGAFTLDQFEYDQDGDAYRCPAGQVLKRHCDTVIRGSTYQSYYNTAACRQCPLIARCTRGKYRKIKRHPDQAAIDRMKQRMRENPEIYRRRAASVEHPFGSMMFWNEGRNLLCKGLEKANAEFSLSALAYNLKRAAKVLGIEKLLEALRRISDRNLCEGCPNAASKMPKNHWSADCAIFSPVISPPFLRSP